MAKQTQPKPENELMLYSIAASMHLAGMKAVNAAIASMHETRQNKDKMYLVKGELDSLLANARKIVEAK